MANDLIARPRKTRSAVTVIRKRESMAHKENAEIRATLVDRLGKLDRSVASDLSMLKDHGSVTSDDISDAAKEAEDAEVNSRLAEVGSREIRAIVAAINRIDEGNYGDCENCNKKIASARLEALPYAVRCITCQAEYERTCDSPERDIFVDDED
jgi:DnaK suppressor protein